MNQKKFRGDVKIKGKKVKSNECENLDNSFGSCFNSNYFRKNIHISNNNLSKSFANLSGNNLEDLDKK